MNFWFLINEGMYGWNLNKLADGSDVNVTSPGRLQEREQCDGREI